MNMSMNQNKLNLDIARVKTSNFLPYTGVDQAFMIKRPRLTRNCEHSKEKLNDMQINKYALGPPKSSYFDKSKIRLVYDCSYSMNQPLDDNDIRLVVPPIVRKQTGSHINEKVSKYYDKLG